MAPFPSDPHRLGAANRDPEEEALGWVVRLNSGEVTTEERREFTIWSTEPDHQLAYSRAERLWSGLGPLLEKQEAAGWPAPEREANDDLPAARSMWQGFRARAAIAASIAVLALAGTQYARVWQYDYVSGAAFRTDVNLSDGSRVALSPDTAMKAQFADGIRSVKLARGEAYFDVHHDAAHPFVISTGQGTVRVLGTAFSVRKAGDGKVVVTVTRGRVRVSSGGRSTDLTPSQQVAFAAEGLGRVHAVDTTVSTAWMRGRLVMQNRPLGEILGELDRYHQGKVVLLNGAARARQINAVVDLRKIDDWLDALASTQGLTIERIGPITVLR